VVTAALTPVDSEGKPDLDRLQRHINMLEKDGSSAVLLAGTTGEGPSFSLEQRKSILIAALGSVEKMEVMAHTGCASLADTISLTRHAFNSGVDKVTIMPPFFFKGISLAGLFDYYCRILEKAVPPEGRLMLYHIPQVTMVPIEFELIDRLLDRYGERVGGIKDSAGDIGHLKALCARYPNLSVFTGNDQLILQAMQSGAVGCVTGVVNTFASLADSIIQAFRRADPQADEHQQQLTRIWKVLDLYQPYTTLMKALVALRYQDPAWMNVLPPLDPMLPAQMERMVGELRQLGLPGTFSWLDLPASFEPLSKVKNL